MRLTDEQLSDSKRTIAERALLSALTFVAEVGFELMPPDDQKKIRELLHSGAGHLRFVVDTAPLVTVVAFVDHRERDTAKEIFRFDTREIN